VSVRGCRVSRQAVIAASRSKSELRGRDLMVPLDQPVKSQI